MEKESNLKIVSANNADGPMTADQVKQQGLTENDEKAMEWEEKMQDELSTGKGKTVVQNISLRELAKKGQDQMSMFTAEDSYGCFCAY